MTKVLAMAEGRRVIWVRWAMVGVVLASAALGLHELAADSLWYDEIWTATALQKPTLVDAWQGLVGDTERPLFYLFVYELRLWNPGEFWLRLPSVAFGLLSLATLYQIGRLLFDAGTGALATILLALSPFHLSYMQEARCYSLYMWLSLLTLYCLTRAWRSGRWQWWAAWAATSILNTYTHYFSVFVLGAEVLIAGILLAAGRVRRRGMEGSRQEVWRDRQKRAFAGLLASLLAIALAFVPSRNHLSATLHKQVLDVAQTDTPAWTPSFWAEAWWQLTTAAAADSSPGASGWVLLALFLFGLGVCGLRRHILLVLGCVIWLGLPFVALALVPSGRVFNVRYVIFALPMILLLAARGLMGLADLLAGLARRWWRGVPCWAIRAGATALLILAVLAVSVQPIQAAYAQPKQPWRELAAFFQEQMLPGEVLLVEPHWYTIALAYYGLDSARAVRGSLDRFHKYADPATGVWYLRSAHNQADPTGEIRRFVKAEGYTRLWHSERIAGQMSLYYKRQGSSGARDLLPVLAGLVQVDPTDPEIHHLLAGEYRHRGQFAAARAEYERARQIEPDNPRWQVLLGRAWAEEGVPERGLDLVRQGVALAPHDASFWIVLGDVYRQLGRTEEAIAAYKQALALDADNRQAARKLKELQLDFCSDITRPS